MSPSSLTDPIAREVPTLVSSDPLGKAVSSVVQRFASAGQVDLRRCLLGFPHPSGGNGHRVRLFRENRDSLRRQVDEWFAGG